MKALNEQRQLLQDLESLINIMTQEIELLRNINYRYCLKHGNEIQSGFVAVPENISFDISGEINSNVIKCQIIDHVKIGIESNYQKINREIIRLS